MPTPDIAAIRAWFPSLTSDFAYLENAGGSQVPGVVADAIRSYMLESYVQVGATYPASRRATEVVEGAHAFMETFMNAGEVGKVVLGPSTTALTTILANAYGETLRSGDEIIVAETNHEANAGPWVRLQELGATIRFWRVDPSSFECSLDDLEAMLNERTRIVAFPHVSNLLGQVVDVPAITAAAHRVGARVVVDGVAYAPHRAIDVSAWGVDWYVFSTYKVYGPHMAAMFGKHEAFAELRGPNHFFIPDSAIPYKFELGGVSHEACAGLLALQSYFQFLAGSSSHDREAIVNAFSAMESLENPLTERLITHLTACDDVRIVGPKSNRVGTISFVSSRETPEEIVARTDAAGVGIRYGHMYAYRLCEAIGIPPEPGVVRVSFVHYNTMEEVERLIKALTL